MLANTFEELILSGNLPTPAGVGMRILQLTRNDDFSAEELGATIMTDSALTGRILKLANSASHASREPATTVSEATMRLGGRTVRDLSLAFSLVSDRRAGKCRAFDYEQYWSKSLCRAVAAQELARVLHLGGPEEAYICGLLADVGRLALACVHPEAYADILESEHANDNSTLLAAEHEHFRINHSEISACMLREWGLPEAFAEAITDFTQAREVGGREKEITDLGTVLRFAELISRICLADESTGADVWISWEAGLDRLQTLLGIDRAELIRLCDSCSYGWIAWGESLEIITGDPFGFAEVFRRIARAKLGDLPEAPQRQERVGRVSETVTVQAEDTTAAIRVLAVDDDPVALAILTRHLTRAGYEVRTATDGQAGLQEALRSSPDMIIADWEMPVMDGLEMCKALRETVGGRKMFFLLLTARTETELLVRAFDVGVDDFVTKPFLPEILFARIKGGIRLTELQRKVERDRQTMMRQVAQLGMLTRKLRATSLTDALTDLPNRRYAMKRLKSEWVSAERTGKPVSLIMADIDRFKLVNDTHGHDAGDAVLRRTAEIIRASFRKSDEVCRLGGEEFLVICKNTGAEDAVMIAERARVALRTEPIVLREGEVTVTASFGVACSSELGVGIDELLRAADEAVYEAKRTGRDRVCSSGRSSVTKTVDRKSA